METDYTKLALEVYDEINLARQVPNALVAGLLCKLEYFDDNIFKYPGCTPIETYEGEKAVDSLIQPAQLNETIEFLKNQEPLPVLVYSKELEKAAQQHVEDLGQAGELSHIGGNSSSPTQRISQNLKWARMVGECIEVGSTTASEIVGSLMIDDGNEERSNRKVLFSKNVRLVGVASAPHHWYGTITVINFAGGAYETGATPEAPAAEAVSEYSHQPIRRESSAIDNDN